MASLRTITRQLKDVDKYLYQYQVSHRSARFEELVCQAFAALLHLPFYHAGNDDRTKPNRVTWLGVTVPPTKAPAGPDGIARAHEFDVVIEATSNHGTKQWSQEFAPCIEHAQTFAKANRLPVRSVYAVLVATQLHERTYHSVKHYNKSGEYKIVPLELSALCAAVDTALLAFTIRHLEVKDMFLDMLECLAQSRNLGDFRSSADKCLAAWQDKVLNLERNTILAIRSYTAMVKVGRNHVGVSEILGALMNDRSAKNYFRRLSHEPGPDDIADCLEQESLGARVGRASEEKLFQPVPLADFRSRCQRRMNAVEEAHGQE